MRTTRPKRVQRYSVSFKGTAQKLSRSPGVQVKDVAAALDVGPVPAIQLAQGAARREAATFVSAGGIFTRRSEFSHLLVIAIAVIKYWPTERWPSGRRRLTRN